MNVFFLPRSEHNYEQRFPLDGADFLFHFTWNGRCARWFYQISDVEGNAVTGQRKLIADWNLLLEIPSGNNPPGQIWSVTSNGTDPSLLDLNRDLALCYITQEEVAEL